MRVDFMTVWNNFITGSHVYFPNSHLQGLFSYKKKKLKLKKKKNECLDRFLHSAPVPLKILMQLELSLSMLLLKDSIHKSSQ